MKLKSQSFHKAALSIGENLKISSQMIMFSVMAVIPLMISVLNMLWVRQTTLNVVQ